MSRNGFLLVVIFAVAFGFVEAAVVVYLRHLLGIGSNIVQVDRSEVLLLTPGIAFLEPQTAIKIISDTAILNVERVREVMTLVMLAAVGIIAGKNLKERLAYFFLAFGIWDIFYYVFLRLTVGWPRSLFDLDIFFLLPTPWAGPVFFPVLISSILVLGSFVYLLRRKNP